MTERSDDKITLYVSNWCAHAMSVEGFLNRYDIPVDLVNIDEDPEARQDLIKLNGGYASVPTLLFPDGSKLTEPSLFELRRKLNLGRRTGIVGKLRSMVSGESE